MKIVTTCLCSIFFLLCTAAPVWAHDAPKKAAAGVAAPASTNLADGEVRKVDMNTKKITVRHGPLANLDMPAKTMDFEVTDAAMLEKVKVGDMIRFSAEKQGSAFTITRIEPVK